MHIRRPQAADLSGMATAATNAMFDDKLIAFVAPYRYKHPECLRLGFLRRAKRRFYQGNHLLVAVTDEQDPDWDGTERIAGYLSATSTKAKAEQPNRPWFSWNNLELRLLGVEAYFVNLLGSDRSESPKNIRIFNNHIQNFEKDEAFPNIHDYWHIDFLAVDPAYRRRGIGSALVQTIQKTAAEEHLPVVLVATDVGRLVYKRAGFVEIRLVELCPDLFSPEMVWYPDSPVEAKSEELPEDSNVVPVSLTS